MRGSRSKLRSRLVQTVTFRPYTGESLHGSSQFGAATDPIACWWQPIADEQTGEREETRDAAFVCFVDGDAFDPVAVPVGSKATLPDGRERPIVEIIVWPDQRTAGVVDHYQLKV